MMKYSVARENSMSDLIEKVNEMMQNGWTPVGGVFITAMLIKDHRGYEEEKYTYAQAMIRNTDEV